MTTTTITRYAVGDDAQKLKADAEARYRRGVLVPPPCRHPIPDATGGGVCALEPRHDHAQHVSVEQVGRRWLVRGVMDCPGPSPAWRAYKTLGGTRVGHALDDPTQPLITGYIASPTDAELAEQPLTLAAAGHLDHVLVRWSTGHRVWERTDELVHLDPASDTPLYHRPLV